MNILSTFSWYYCVCDFVDLWG